MAIVLKSSGDLFNCDADILVNAVNCEGVMGAGIAAAFRDKFPLMFKDYVKHCEAKMVPGINHVFVEDGKTIINFPTKYLVANPSEILYIVRSLAGFVATLVALKPSNVMFNKKPLVAIPALGCGLGGLEWEQVKPLIISAISHPLVVDFYDFVVFDPQ